jgi:uncharacterized protein
MAENRSNKSKIVKSENIAPSGLDAIAAAARQATPEKQPGERKFPPVHLWNPPHCGDIGLRIACDGTWFYQNSPIGRMPLVKLFASVLRKDADEHVLVTPVEKISVAVEDAPFLAVEMQIVEKHGRQVLAFRTNVDDWIEAGPGHEIRFEAGPASGIKPYVRVRADLWALVTRSLFYDLVEIGHTQQDERGEDQFGVTSAGVFFPMAPAGDLDD